MNIVTGSRDHLTKYLSEHQDVDAMWYVIKLVRSWYVVEGGCLIEMCT